MYISYSNEIVDQFSKEIDYYEKVLSKLRHPDSVKDKVEAYKKHIGNVKSALKDIQNSVKFKIPSCNQLLSEDSPPFEVLKKFVEVANLPYPCICLELEAFSVTSDQNMPCVVIAKQGEVDILIYALNKTTEWQLMESEDYEVISTDLNRTTLEGWIGGFKKESYSNQDILDLMRWVVDIPIRSVVNLICTLSCSNAHIEDHPDKPSKLKNDLRKKKKKLPFYEFKILTLDSGKGVNPESGSSTGGIHASPRVHLRRGHIRKLPTKNVWVNACVVGDKSKGEIAKEYLVK